MSNPKEYAVNDRRNWKAETFPYDHFIPDESRECTYCLTDKQAEILRGIIQPLGWGTRWWSETQNINNDDIEAFRDDLIRRLMMSCCGDEVPIRYRWNNGVYERSTDGGETWEDATAYSYMNTSTIWPDPNELGIATEKCQAADGVIQVMKVQVVEALSEGSTAAAILGIVAAALVIFLDVATVGAITAAAPAIGAAIVAFGVVAMQAAFTEEVWNDFLCMVYCAMDTDTSISVDGVEELLEHINTDFTGIVVPVLYSIVQAAGQVGLTNMMRSGEGSVDADCSACCPDCSTLFTLFEDWEGIGQTITYEEDGSLTIVAVPVPATSNYYVILSTHDQDVCCTVIDYNITGEDPLIGHTLCGNTISEYSPQFYPALLPTGEINMLYLNASAPFTVNVMFG